MNDPMIRLDLSPYVECGKILLAKEIPSLSLGRECDGISGV